MTRLSDLIAEPITPAELSSAVRKGDPTLIRTAVTLRDSWKVREDLQRAKIKAEAELSRVNSTLESVRKVMPRPTENTAQDVAELVSYALRMTEVATKLKEVCASLRRAGGDQESIANSIEELVRQPPVPVVLARR